MRMISAAVLFIFCAVEMLKSSYLGAALTAAVLVLWFSDRRPAMQVRSLLTLSSACLALGCVSRAFDFSSLWNLGAMAAAIFAGLALLAWRKPNSGKLLTPAAFMLGLYLFAGGWMPPTASRLALGDGSTGYIVSGVWASPANEAGGANIQSEYASSRFIERIGATVLDAGAELPDLSGYARIVLFTPTRPLTEKATEQLMRWVRRGGRLIVIVDHTDLFGHARVANAVLGHAGLRANYDAVLPPVDGYVYYYGIGTRLAGLTACSLQGKGDPVYWTMGYAEAVDYGGASFFGDLSPTEGDDAGLHFVGMRTTCGLGEVVAFGDSTFFANFSLERCASSIALRELTSGRAGIPAHDIGLAAMLFMLIPWRLATIAAMLSASFLFIGGSFQDKPHVDSGATVLSGDTDLTDRESGPLAGLIAAHHAYGAPPVRWGTSSAGSGHLAVGGIDLHPAPRTPRTSTLDSAMDEALSHEFVRLFASRDLNSVSHFGSVWFDDGVGALRDEVFSSFWKKTEFSLSVVQTEQMRFGKINGRTLPSPISVRVHWLSSGQGWALLGRGYVARWIPEQGVFLVRSSWQMNHLEINTLVLGARCD